MKEIFTFITVNRIKKADQHYLISLILMQFIFIVLLEFFFLNCQ